MTTAASTQRVVDIDPGEFSARLAGDGLGMQIGPFRIWLKVDVRDIHKILQSMYAEYPLVDRHSVFTLHARLSAVGGALRQRRVRFEVDGYKPHEDMPVAQSLAVLEWGLNLVLALRSHCFLILHSAVLEKGGHSLLLPAAPGFGKTTLCAALAHCGWRLLSDEFGLVRPRSNVMIPIPRPMALKNRSIQIIRKIAPDAWVGPSISGTRKGTVAHVKAPQDSIYRQAETAPPRWIVFPRWEQGAPTMLKRNGMADSFMLLAVNAFNYEMLGEAGFRTVRDLVSDSDLYRLVYSNLDTAIERINGLADV